MNFKKYLMYYIFGFILIVLILLDTFYFFSSIILTYYFITIPIALLLLMLFFAKYIISIRNKDKEKFKVLTILIILIILSICFNIVVNNENLKSQRVLTFKADIKNNVYYEVILRKNYTYEIIIFLDQWGISKRKFIGNYEFDGEKVTFLNNTSPKNEIPKEIFIKNYVHSSMIKEMIYILKINKQNFKNDDK